MICMFAILRSICLQYWYFAVPYFIMSEIKSVHKGRHPVLMGIPDENLTGENHEQFVSEWNSESEGKSEAGFTHRRRAEKVELPLKLLVAGDFSNGQEERPLSERTKQILIKTILMMFWQISPRLCVWMWRTRLPVMVPKRASAWLFAIWMISHRSRSPDKFPVLKLCWPCAACCAIWRLICWITPLFVRNWKNPAWSCAEPGVT